MRTPGYLEMTAIALLHDVSDQQQCLTCILLELKFWTTDTADKCTTRGLNFLNHQHQRWYTACTLPAV